MMSNNLEGEKLKRKKNLEPLSHLTRGGQQNCKCTRQATKNEINAPVVLEALKLQAEKGKEGKKNFLKKREGKFFHHGRGNQGKGVVVVIVPGVFLP